MKAKFLIVFFGVLFSSSSYATLEQCYKDGFAEDYENVLISCEPYLKKDARATGLLAEANIQLDIDDKVALEDATWAVDFYEKNGAPTSIEGRKAYAYLVYLIGELYYFGSSNGYIKVEQAKGFQYIEKAGGLGYAVAQNQLGNFYVRSGKNPSPNFAQAYRWYKLAVANGNLDARKAFLLNHEEDFIKQYPYCISQGGTLIGNDYFEGKGGLLKNNNKALFWYKKAYGVDHVSPVEVGFAKVYIADENTKKAFNYAKEAITQPYAPAFVIMSQLVKSSAAKYAYLTLAVSLFKSPELKFWDQFNEYCLPDLSEKGLEDAQAKLKAISINAEQKKQADKLIKALKSHWKSIAVVD